jgi:hypothetical protein
MTLGLLSSSDEDSVVQVLAHWFRSMASAGKTPPAYERLLQMHRKRFSLSSFAAASTQNEKIVLKMLLQKGEGALTLENLLAVIFGERLEEEPYTKITLLLMMKAYSAVKMLEMLLLPKTLENLAVFVPRTVLDAWLVPFSADLLALFRTEKYVNLATLEKVIRGAVFVYQVVATIAELMLLIDGLSDAVAYFSLNQKNFAALEESVKAVAVVQDFVATSVTQINASAFPYAKLFKSWASKKLYEIRKALFHYYAFRNVVDTFGIKKLKFFRDFFRLEEMFPNHLYSQVQTVDLNRVLLDYYLAEENLRKKIKKNPRPSSSLLSDEDSFSSSSSSSLIAASLPPIHHRPSSPPKYLVKSM